MQIHFRQTGGFAGLIRVASLDTEQLPPPEAEALMDLVAAADFFSRSPSPPSPQPDRETYTVTIQDSRQGDRTLHFSAATLPPECQPLIQALVKQATYEKRRP